MNKKITIFILFLLIGAGSIYITAQVYVTKNHTTHLVSYVYQDFEGDPSASFLLRWSPFGIEEKIQMKTYNHVPVGLGEYQNMGGKVAKSENSLGIHASFARKGFNWIDLVPKNFKPFKGKVQSLSCWVWGGNFAYDMVYIVEDYLEFQWPLPVANLKFFGWKNLRTQVPGSIPQEEPYIPRRRGLALNRIRLYANPIERADRFHVFFDEFKVVTDTYKTLYDGLDLEETVRNELYGDLYGDQETK